MTIEQLEKANEIYKQLNTIQYFQDNQNKYCLGAWKIIVGDYELSLSDYTDLKVMIENYVSDKIAELKKQLEEL